VSDIALRVEKLSKSFQRGQRYSNRRFYELLESLGSELVKLPVRLLNGSKSKGLLKDESFWALDDVSFEVPQGEVLGFVGRNGAGKSTLLKLLTKITYPTRGRIEIHGRIGSLLEVGTGFHPELTGRENIYLNGAVLGMSRAEIGKKFDEIVAFSEIERFLDTPVKRYSSGMYIRLAFAVAAHLEPEILIVDEVLAVGDASFQQKCIAKMGAASRQGRTVLIVSHSLPIIANLCHRAALLEGGRLIDIGPPADIVRRYMASVRSETGEVVWPLPETAPGTEAVRLHAVRVVQEAGSTSDIDSAKVVAIQILYWNLQDGQQLYVGLWLKDSNGTFVLATSNVKSVSATDDPWYGVSQPIGLYEATCTLPGQFLNRGRYVISAIVGRVPNRKIIVEESVLTFDVYDTGVPREEFFEIGTGPVVRPSLVWKTSQQTSL
jgi:lipopolysaccharide transport system ATP-binding protein